MNVNTKTEALWYFPCNSDVIPVTFTGNRSTKLLNKALVTISGWVFTIFNPYLPFSKSPTSSIREGQEAEATKIVAPRLV
jgi:hypothetical protein